VNGEVRDSNLEKKNGKKRRSEVIVYGMNMPNRVATMP